MDQTSTSRVPGGSKLTQAEAVRTEVPRGRPKMIKPGEVAAVLWYKHDGYPYWPSMVKHMTTDRSKCTVSLLNLGVLEKTGITVALNCLKKRVKDFLGDDHADLVDAGFKSGHQAFETAMRKSRFWALSRGVNTTLSTFFVETGYLTNGSSSGVTRKDNLTDHAQKCNRKRSAVATNTSPIGGTAVANQRVRTRSHARSNSENSRPVSRRMTDKRRCLSEGRGYALSTTGEADANFLDDLAEVADSETDDRKQCADERSPAAASVGRQPLAAVDDLHCEDPGEHETEIGASRIVVEVEVHAPFDGNSSEPGSRARPLLVIDERSKSASFEGLRRLAIALDWNDDLMVLDDGTPTKFRSDMLVWYKHKEEPFWPALIESVKEGKFTVRLLNCGSASQSVFTVNEEEASKVLLPYPGADYLALTGGGEKCRDATAFVEAVKQANAYVQMKQGRRISVGAGDFFRRSENSGLVQLKKVEAKRK